MKIQRKTCLIVCVSVFLLYLAMEYWPVVAGLLLKCLTAAIPLLVGCVMAYIINILMSFYERHYFPRSKKRFIIKSRRPVCLLAALATVLAIAALVIGLVVPQLISCVSVLAAELPGAVNTSISWLQSHGLLPENVLQALSEVDWSAVLNKIGGWLTSGLGSMVDVVVQTVSSVISGIVTAFLGLIFALYLLLSKEKLGRQSNKLLKHYLKENHYNKLHSAITVLNDCFHRYIVGQCTEAVILGVLCLVGMLILRLPYATMISALVAFTALIPVAGAYIGAAVGAFMILTVSPVKALIFLIFLVILQQVEGNLIYPKVVGSSLDLPPIWVLAAVTVGGGVLGIPGMLLGVPITAALYRMLRIEVNKPKRCPAVKTSVEEEKTK